MQYGYDPRLFDISRIPTWDGFVQAWKISLLKPSTTACPTVGPTVAVSSPSSMNMFCAAERNAASHPFLMTYRVNSDIRDMPGATWRDIIADILEDCNGRARWKRFTGVWKDISGRRASSGGRKRCGRPCRSIPEPSKRQIVAYGV